jgi:hypothetical protein
MSNGEACSHRKGAGFSLRLPIAAAGLPLETTRIPGPAMLARL